MNSVRSSLNYSLRALIWSLFALGCATAVKPEPAWPPLAKKWYVRANQSFRSLDAEDAEVAIQQALRLYPEREEVRLLAARIALSKLDFKGALKHTQGMTDASARSLRGRALWYAEDTVAAGSELELLLADPQVRDPWAEGVVKLAREGSGRKPFALKGGLLAVVDMPRMTTTAMIVPVELDGQPVLAMVSTGNAEVVVDSSGGRSAGWVSLRFGRRLEVKDVPALAQDLSGVSRQLNAPIKVLLGSRLLRRLNTTVDFLGRQFVVRSFEAPPPPAATKIPLQYIQGGGMVVRTQIGAAEAAPHFAFMLDTGQTFPLALDEPAWERTSLDLALRRPVAREAGVSQLKLSQLRIGAFSIPNVPALGGVPFEELEQSLDIELDGLMGSGLLSAFRVTFADGGRSLWLEDAPVPLPARPVADPESPLPGSAEPGAG